MQSGLRTDLNGLALQTTGDCPVAPSNFGLGSSDSTQRRKHSRPAVSMFRIANAIQTNILHQTYRQSPGGVVTYLGATLAPAVRRNIPRGVLCFVCLKCPVNFAWIYIQRRSRCHQGTRL